MTLDELAVRKDLIKRAVVDSDGVRLCHSCKTYHGPVCCVEVESKRICGKPTVFGTTHHGLCAKRERGEITRDEYRQRTKW